MQMNRPEKVGNWKEANYITKLLVRMYRNICIVFCMCVCVCVYVYVCIPVYIYIYIYIYIITFL